MPRATFHLLAERELIDAARSILSRRPRLTPSTPLNCPASGKSQLRILARKGRYVVGVHRRQMKAIRYLGALDGLFGVPTTTRNWNTIRTIARVLGDGRT